MAKKKKELSDAETEELEIYCQDEFYYDIYEDLVDKDLFKPLDFFKLLDAQTDFVETNKARPLFVAKQLEKLPFNTNQLDYLFQHLTAYFQNDDDEQLRICWREISRVHGNLKIESELPKPEKKNVFAEILEHCETLQTYKEKIAFLIKEKTKYEQNQVVGRWDNAFSTVKGKSIAEKCQLEINKLEKLMQLETTRKQIDEGNKKHKDLTLDRATLFFSYLFTYAKANCHNTKKAQVISFLTRYSENTVGDKLSALHSKADENFVAYEKDMKIVQKYFENLGLPEIAEKIDRDLKIPE